jgi:GT2 family glycosyltransferase
VTPPETGPALDAEASERSANGDFSPARIIEVELSDPLPKIEPGEQYRRIWALARLHTEPVGVCVAPLTAEGLSPDEFAALIWRELSEPIGERFVAAGLPRPAELTGDGLKAEPDAWPFLRRRSAILADAPHISVVICTRDRPDQLAKCLKRLELLEYPRFEVVVVDNAPTSDAVRNLVKSYVAGATTFNYCVEPRPGLSWARNAGVAAATGDIIAFLDDDDEPDKYWLAGIADGFARNDRIGSVTGMILPARLDTVAEELFEQVGGHRKGRGFVKETFSRSGPQSPLFPLPPFGAGANMAFRREVIHRIGGFDVALGAGTVAAASEDTLALTLTLLSGYEIAYEPAALMWHHHRQDMDSLSRQLHGYSVGLTAFYAALLRHRPSVLPGLLKLVPAAIGYMKGATTDSDVPPDLLERLNRRHLQGMLSGPLAYVRGTRAQRRVAVPGASSPGLR